MASDKTALVVTSIAAPNASLKALAQGARSHGMEFIVIGDQTSPASFELDGCRFYGLEEQRRLDLRFARAAPAKHYARKNIGYLLALRNGAEIIVETDDDNVPRAGFWEQRIRHHHVRQVSGSGWVNVYRYFSAANIWPRGLPLDVVQSEPPPLAGQASSVDCPIQQGLADGDPDVDAIYRLVLPLPQNFEPGIGLALGNGAWSPFNSQNTAWWRDAAPLLYLPSYCPFRMTDIWRSFVAQRIAWANGWSILFHSPTVWQDRNVHNFMRDFADEVRGYLGNRAIGEALDGLAIQPGVASIPDNLRICYRELARMQTVDAKELDLLEDWLADLSAIT